MPTIHFTGRAATAGDASRALTRAAVAASRAPSLLPGQPWRWRIADDVAELYADRAAQPATAHAAAVRPATADPAARLLVASGGAALQHAYAALGGTGAVIDVTRLPDPDHPELLARITVRDFASPAPAAVRMQRAIALRGTDRPGAAVPLPNPTLAELRIIAAAYGGIVEPLTEPGYLMLAATDDTWLGWLRAGEAYSAMTLVAIPERLVLVPAAPADRLRPAPVGLPSGGRGGWHPLAVLMVGSMSDPAQTGR